MTATPHTTCSQAGLYSLVPYPSVSLEADLIASAVADGREPSVEDVDAYRKLRDENRRVQAVNAAACAVCEVSA